MDGQLSLFDDNDPLQWEPSEKRIVYFIECGKFIKIGFTSRSVEERRRELRTGNPYPMHIIGSLIVGEDVDDRDLQRDRRFARFHAHDEWFHNVEELRVAIRRTINGQRTTPPVRLSQPPFRNREFLFSVDCPECKAFLAWVWQFDECPLPDDVFAHVTCGRCGIRIPLVWEEGGLIHVERVKQN